MDMRKGKALESPFHWLKIGKIVLIGILVLSSIFAINQIALSRFFLIKTVKVYGVHRLDHREVQHLLLPLVNRGFFTVNVDNIRERLLQHPWIADLNVRRLWPDQIEVRVIEKNAIARWNDSLLTETGELFSPEPGSYPEDLPKFVGPDGRQMVMLNYFNQLNRLFSPLHAKIAYLELTPYFTWKLALNNGITLQVGHKDILTRLDQFVKVYPKIVGNRAADVEYIDLRYPNGLAVRWKKPVKA